MIFSRPKELPLPFKADLELIDGGNGEFLLANSFGKLLIFNSSLEVLHELNLARRFLSLDFSSAYKIIAFANEHAFYIYDLSGEVIFHMQADYEKLKIVGDKLWAIKKQSPQKKQLEIYQMGSWDLLAKTEFADPFGESQISCAQLAAEHADALLMQFSEGTDNRRLISWELIGKKIRAKHTSLGLHFPESYSPSRKKYLYTDTHHLYVHHSDSHHRIYAYEIPAELGVVLNPFFLSENRILLPTEDGRFPIFDLFSKKLIDSLYIKIPQSDGLENFVSSFPAMISRVENWVFMVYQANQGSKKQACFLYAFDLNEYELEGKQLKLFG